MTYMAIGMEVKIVFCMYLISKDKWKAIALSWVILLSNRHLHRVGAVYIRPDNDS